MTTLTAKSGLSRRRLLQTAGAAGALAAALPYVATEPAAATTTAGLAADEVARTYHRVLLRHTRWAETQWDESAGHYVAKDFSFAVVLGNAVLLTRDGYDADLAGIDAATLKQHTVATLSHFAASNRLLGGTEWGQKLFWDTTFQLYFQLAGRLLWDDLDASTRTNLDLIATRQADYTVSLGSGNDPLSGSWTPNGLAGGWVGDTKLEEMGVYAQSIAPAMAWAPQAGNAPGWRDWYARWSRNETGHPAADHANPAMVDGARVSSNTAHNLYDTFLVENHGSFGPHYQCELWRTSGRNGIHFIAAGQPMPAVLAEQPNGDRLWRSILAVMSDAGEPLMPMVADREHLYGRDVIPIAFLAQVLGDRRAAWAEQALAARLDAYQAYPPEYRITKFSGQPKYEPEARAEVAISYLLHEWRAREHGPVQPMSAAEVFADASGVLDFGTGPGLVAHQSPAAWAGAVSKPGFAKFCWQPGHDDWLFTLSGKTPMFLPATGATVRGRSVAAYTRSRDGFDASAVVLGFDAGRAGFASLPGGSVVYASSGVAAGEGHLEVYNLTMPGVPGLDGDRTYTAAEGGVTVPAAENSSGAARVDTVRFAATSARWVRMLGVTPDPTYGYSVIEFQVRDGDGANLALGQATSASSADRGHDARYATDGDDGTRWAVSRADRPRSDSWLAVDLGATTTFDRVKVYWEAAAGRAYRVQVSADGASWTDVASYPNPDLSSTGGWLNVDGRAGLVVRGSKHPITVQGNVITLADGAAAPLLVEGHPGLDAAATRAAAAKPAPSTDADGLLASLAEGHLSLFNLTAAPLAGTVTIPPQGETVPVFAGTQTTTADGTAYQADLAAGSAAVLAPWFTIEPVGRRRLPAGLVVEVVDAHRLRLHGPSGPVRVRSRTGGDRVVVAGGHRRDVVFHSVPPYPIDDLALGRVTFPTSPLPDGMTDPAAAVDGHESTAWTPGRAGRMVVDLGSDQPLDAIELDWTSRHSPAVTVSTSTDGLSYREAARLRAGQRRAGLDRTARYVAVAVPGWRHGDPRLRRLTVRPA
ncbi:hypothetical protein Athai_09830 [Actinocatenispora thailandica]|uniref:F5/8 type C domain-containing protein n=1 Tax=Actinocatenispora thailandica TaxID=227318 RepID=A0A7R7DKQ4_9ACTN|nr:discoidin domain-containing protein [Actinocatenispora thailandica]BCJ33480.1 hypothetical protein Athai_09830 [Actinocatenispora thailandica]